MRVFLLGSSRPFSHRLQWLGRGWDPGADPDDDFSILEWGGVPIHPKLQKGTTKIQLTLSICVIYIEREGYYQLYKDFKKPSSRSLLNQSGFHVNLMSAKHKEDILTVSTFRQLRLKLVDCSSCYKPGRIFFRKKNSVTG